MVRQYICAHPGWQGLLPDGTQSHCKVRPDNRRAGNSHLAQLAVYWRMWQSDTANAAKSGFTLVPIFPTLFSDIQPRGTANILGTRHCPAYSVIPSHPVHGQTHTLGDVQTDSFCFMLIGWSGLPGGFSGGTIPESCSRYRGESVARIFRQGRPYSNACG